MSDEVQAAKWAGVAVGAIGLVAGVIATWWRMATARFARHAELEESIAASEESTKAAIKEIIAAHERVEMPAMERQDQRIEELHRMFGRLVEHLENLPTRSELQQQQQAVRDQQAAIHDLSRSVHRLAGRLGAPDERGDRGSL